MYKVFIVDDEPLARYGLRDYFDWTKHNCVIVGEAEDGEKALSAIEKVQPDLVITDVRMPNMDGIELAEHLTKQYKDIKIVFISGYDDVSYLKSAFKVRAVDYILKPINLAEVETLIQKVTDMIANAQRQKDILRKMDVKLIQSMPLLQGKFFMTLINDKIIANEKFRETMDFAGVHFNLDSMFCVSVIVLDDITAVFDNFIEKDYQRMSFAILNICQELIEKHFSGYVFENNRGEYVCILNLNDDSEEEKHKLITFAEDVKNNLLNYFSLSVTIGIGQTLNGIQGISDAYKSAVNAVNQKLFLGKNKIIVMDGQDSNNKVYKFDFSLAEKLKATIRTSDYEKTCIQVNDFFDTLLLQENISLKYVQSICFNLISIPNQVIWENNIGITDYDINEQKQIEDFFALDTIDDMKIFVLKIYKDACEFITKKREGKQKSLITSVKQFIDNNYTNRFTINDIAKELFFNSTYLSFIFKQETGQTINDYITQVRMEKAKELLCDPKIKVDTICYSVGYQEPSYFSRMFKKHTGLSPRQYRETI